GESNEESVQDIKEKVHTYSVDSFDDETASITSHELIVNENGSETTYDLPEEEDRKSTRLNSSHVSISYPVFCLQRSSYNSTPLYSRSKRTLTSPHHITSSPLYPYTTLFRSGRIK